MLEEGDLDDLSPVSETPLSRSEEQGIPGATAGVTRSRTLPSGSRRGIHSPGASPTDVAGGAANSNTRVLRKHRRPSPPHSHRKQPPVTVGNSG